MYMSCQHLLPAMTVPALTRRRKILTVLSRQNHVG
jgi:hypothetical protein